MRSRSRFADGLVVVVAALVAATAALAQDFASTLSARVSLHDGAGRPITQVKPNEVFTLKVEIDDAITDAPAGGLDLEGWIRPREASNLPCSKAAQSFRATGRLPIGAVDLGGAFLVTVNDDASFGIVDPERNLATANLVKAGRLPELPAAMAGNSELQRLYFALPRQGTVLGMMLPSGEPSPFVTQLDEPAALYPAGIAGLWVFDKHAATLFAPDGAARATHRLGLAPIRHAEIANGPLLAYGGDGATLVLDRRTGRAVTSFAGPAGAVAVALLAGAGNEASAVAFARADADLVELRYLDDTARKIEIRLPWPAARLLASPDGRYLIATGDRHHVAVIDIATAQLAQAAEMARPIRETAISGQLAVLLYADTSTAAILDLATVRPGKAIELREISLGSPATAVPDDARLLLPLTGGAQIMAVNRDARVGMIVDQHSMAIGAPPMAAVSLRGGIVRGVALVPRGFHEEKKGLYVTATALPAGGDHELVLTTGVRGLSYCQDIRVDGPDRRLRTLLVRLDPAGVFRAGSAAPFRFTVTGEDGSVLPIRRAALTVQSLSFSMRELRLAQGDNGRLSAELVFPAPGSYVVNVDIGAGRQFRIAPVVVEVSE